MCAPSLLPSKLHTGPEMYAAAPLSSNPRDGKVIKPLSPHDHTLHTRVCSTTSLISCVKLAEYARGVRSGLPPDPRLLSTTTWKPKDAPALAMC